MWHSKLLETLPPFMAKGILNFHFDYLKPSLTLPHSSSCMLQNGTFCRENVIYVPVSRKNEKYAQRADTAVYPALLTTSLYFCIIWQQGRFNTDASGGSSDKCELEVILWHYYSQLAPSVIMLFLKTLLVFNKWSMQSGQRFIPDQLCTQSETALRTWCVHTNRKESLLIESHAENNVR